MHGSLNKAQINDLFNEVLQTEYHYAEDMKGFKENHSKEEQNCKRNYQQKFNLIGETTYKTWSGKDQEKCIERARIEDQLTRSKGKHKLYIHTWGNKEQVETVRVGQTMSPEPQEERACFLTQEESRVSK